jgi:hypothetical protein
MSALFLKRRLMLEEFGGSLPNSSPAKIEAERDDARVKPRSPPPLPSKKVSKDGNKFPVLLFRMLQTESSSSANDHDHDVVSWSPKGTSFMIRNTEAFTERILPRYFGKTATKYRSFQRQLNLYGFSRDSSASKGGCSNYQHPKFVRDHPELVAGIQRKQETNNNSNNTNKQEQVQSPPPPKNVSARKKQLTTIKEQQAEARRRRVSLDTLASAAVAEPPQDPIAAVVASYLAAKSISNSNKQQAEPPSTTTNKPPRRRRKSSSTKQKADTTLEDVCNVLLLPQEDQRQDQDARQSLDEAFRVFLQEEDDDSWDLVIY